MKYPVLFVAAAFQVAIVQASAGYAQSVSNRHHLELTCVPSNPVVVPYSDYRVSSQRLPYETPSDYDVALMVGSETEVRGRLNLPRFRVQEQEGTVVLTPRPSLQGICRY